jgi:glycosyl transferase family 87
MSWGSRIPVKNRAVGIGWIVLTALIAWNLWLPEAYRYFNAVETDLLGRTPNPDFRAYYIAGAAFDAGWDPYASHAAHELAPADRRLGVFSRFIYPPTFLPLYARLSRLDFGVARCVWGGIGALAYLMSFALLLWNGRADQRPRLLILGTILSLISHSLLFHIRQGQIDIIVFSVALLSFLVYRGGHRFASAFLLSCAVLAKLNPIALLATFVAYYRDRAYAVYFAICLAAVTGLSLFVVPFPLYREYARVIVPSVAGVSTHFVNQSLLRPAQQAGLASMVISALGTLGFAAWAWMLGGSRGAAARQSVVCEALDEDTSAHAVYLMNTLVLLLFSPISWAMAYVWVILPAAKFLAGLPRRASGSFLAAIGLAIYLLNAKLYAWPVLGSLNLLGGLLLLTCLGLLLWRPAWVIATE